MKNKTVNLIAITGAAAMMTLGMGTAVAGSKHNVADFNHDGMVTSEELVTYVQMNFLKWIKTTTACLVPGKQQSWKIFLTLMGKDELCNTSANRAEV